MKFRFPNTEVEGEFSNIPLVLMVNIKIPLSVYHIFCAIFLGKKTLTGLYFMAEEVDSFMVRCMCRLWREHKLLVSLSY